MKTSEQIDKIMPAIVAARGEMRFVAKGGNNTFDKYNYARLDNYMRVVEDPLEKNKLFIVTSADSCSQLDPRTTKSGGSEFVVRLTLTMRVVHESGQWMEISIIGDGQDRGDKGIYKANTGARKYGYAMLFGLTTSDDPEETSPEPPPPNRPVPKDDGDTKESAKSMFSRSVGEWIGSYDRNPLAAACKKIAAANKIELGKATDPQFLQLRDYVIASREEKTYVEWSGDAAPAKTEVKG